MKHVDTFQYLGSLITEDAECSKGIREKLVRGPSTWGRDETNLEIDLGVTLVCQSDPTWYKSDPKSTSSRRFVLKRLEATWVKNNRL